MDFNLVCAVYNPNEDTPELETLYFRDGCVHFRRDAIRYIDKYHTVVVPYERDVIGTYINRSTHVKKYIIIIYIDFLKEQDLRQFESNDKIDENKEPKSPLQKKIDSRYTTCSTSYRYAFYSIPYNLEQSMIKLLVKNREELNKKLESL